uniref:3'-5' exonuclease domain-containing protein n=1 Tax=Heterosigma akashiwo TaxID=2829 RepID=A0A7S4D4X0_HETAK
MVAHAPATLGRALARALLARPPPGAPDAGLRAVCRLGLGDDPEFAPLLSAPMDELLADSANDKVRKSPVQEDGPILSLPDPLPDVRVVDSMAGLLAMEQRLMFISGAECLQVGLDAEWRPFSNEQKPTKCALLQVASRTHIFLLDLLGLEEEEDSSKKLDCLLSWLFSSPEILKLGYGFQGDVERLRWSYPGKNCYFCRIANFFDLKIFQDQPHRDLGQGLQGLCKKILGAALDKRMQTSNWENRPLMHEQIEYAALDAFCLLQLYNNCAGAVHSGSFLSCKKLCLVLINPKGCDDITARASSAKCNGACSRNCDGENQDVGKYGVCRCCC